MEWSVIGYKIENPKSDISRDIEIRPFKRDGYLYGWVVMNGSNRILDPRTYSLEYLGCIPDNGKFARKFCVSSMNEAARLAEDYLNSIGVIMEEIYGD